jgi:hypothetical protein
MIQQTTDYKKFKVINGNREIQPGHLKTLVNSISENNLLEYNPIIVTEDFEIIDGQHRLAAAKKLQLPIYFQVGRARGIDDVILLNKSLRPWGILDYLNSYVKRGFTDYRILKDFCYNYNMSISIAMGIIGQSRYPKWAGLMRDFKDGLFKVTRLDWGVEFANFLSDLRIYLAPLVERDREFIWALEKTLSIVKKEELLEKIKFQTEPITRSPSTKEYLRKLEDIINYKLKTQKRLY